MLPLIYFLIDLSQFLYIVLHLTNLWEESTYERWRPAGGGAVRVDGSSVTGQEGGEGEGAKIERSGVEGWKLRVAIGDRPGVGEQMIQNTVVTGGAERWENSVRISIRALVRTYHCQSLELHHLMIRTHRTGWWPEKIHTHTYILLQSHKLLM